MGAESSKRPTYIHGHIVTYLFRTTGQVLGVSFSGTVPQAVLGTKLHDYIRGPHTAETVARCVLRIRF